MIKSPAFLLAAAAVAAAACAGSPRRSEPLMGPLVMTEPAQFRGRAVFLEDCYKCHPGGEAGVGPSLNDRRLPSAWARRKIRRGHGRMPAFGKSRLNDKQLDDLMAYMAALREHSERVQEPLEAQEASR